MQTGPDAGGYRGALTVGAKQRIAFAPDKPFCPHCAVLSKIMLLSA